MAVYGQRGHCQYIESFCDLREAIAKMKTLKGKSVLTVHRSDRLPAGLHVATSCKGRVRLTTKYKTHCH
jgi:hypothetical protein